MVQSPRDPSAVSSTATAPAPLSPASLRRFLQSGPNLSTSGSPSRVLTPTNTAALCAAVKEASRRGERIVLAAGRHGREWREEGALALDLSCMKRVDVDATRRLVRVQAGTTVGELDAACQPHGLACVTGVSPRLGVVGLSLAGGCGFLSRQYGLAVDNFVSAEVVLADGTAVTATKDNQHSELFWGLQGGGSNLGIVSSLTMRAHPIKYAYSGLVMNLAPSSGSAHSTIRNWAEWIGRSARSVSGACVLACGQPVVSTAIVEADTQAVDQGELASQTIRDFPSLAPLRGCGFSGAFGACASIKSLQRTDYHSGTQRMLEGFQKPGHYHSATLVVPELGGKLLDTLVDFTRNRHPNSTSAVITFPLGGAVAEMKEGCTACNLGRGMPGAFWVLIQGQFQPGGGDRKQVVAWVRDLRASLIEGGAMETMDTLDGNFVVGNNQAPSSALGTSEARLQRTKARYDPNNLFQCNRNIRPTTASQPKPQQPVIPSLKMPPYAKEKEVDGAVPVDGVVISPRHRPPPTPPPRMSPKAVYRL